MKDYIDIADNVYFGTYKLTNEKVLLNALFNAFNAGYKKFDCAELYKNQAVIGKFVRHIGRLNIWLTSKISFRVIPKGEAAIRASIEKTLADLRCGYLDLMLIHSPSGDENDLMAWRILQEYKKRGLILNIGISNYNLEKLQNFIEDIEEAGWSKNDIFCNQIEFNPFLNRKELIDYCQDAGIKIVTYGNLYYTNEFIEDLAKRLGRTRRQVLARYAIHKGFEPILMAEDSTHIWENIELEFEIDKKDIEVLDGFHNGQSQYKRYL
jgi:diketogulonate reductase-like aldo/keto reductase